MKKIILLLLAITFTVVITGCTAEKTTDSSAKVEEGGIRIVDDLGKTIIMKEPAGRIISLYSAHTENLFALGLDDEIIGVGTKDSYPPCVVQKDVFDYRSDPEKVIAVNPDLVLIRPFISKSSPDFVKALENAGINVVCLYPDKFDDFIPYINKLAKLTGKEEEAEKLIINFKKELSEIENITKDIKNKKRVYFESTEKEYRTITNDCMAANAIRIAGGINVASDARPVKEGSSIASYGAERILARADEIDVYVAQRGAMNAGGTPHSIRIRPGFDTIKAVRENKIYNIDEKLISSPTFRFATGVRELARFFYPEIFDDLSKYRDKEQISRQEMAEIVVKYKHKPVFSPNWRYYKQKKDGHVYGGFKDVPIEHPYFNYIETAVLSGYIDCNDVQYHPEKPVTRDELANIIFMMFDVKDKSVPINIKDIKNCKNAKIVEMLCKNGIMNLDENSNFNPELYVSGNEVLEAFEKARNL